MKRRSIIWFRSDLRLHDNEALSEALSVSDEVIPLFIFDSRVFSGKTSFGFPKTGPNRASFILDAVRALRNAIKERGGDLIVRVGLPEEIVYEMALKYKTNGVFCNRERTSEEVYVQDEIERRLWSIGREMRYQRGKMLLHTQDLPFPVTHTPDSFAVFKKETANLVMIRSTFPVPEEINTIADVDLGEIPSLEELGCGAESQVGFEYKGGEDEALKIASYVSTQSVGNELIVAPYVSPWLSHGCLSPKYLYHMVEGDGGSGFLDPNHPIINGLLMRDHLRLLGKKYKKDIFNRVGPRGQLNETLSGGIVEAQPWIQAETGVPIIDACMSKLSKTGFISYEARQLAASFLIGEMKVDWLIGAQFFESCLVDYDPCSNYCNWNQLAGVSAEHHKFRQVNLESQHKRLDPDGTFVDKWLA